uniref:non-specific serine/threonine protein kinase n=1 Tax=Solanum tuberosum TaxID=4113 RepID=M1CM19_SOLTU
MEQEFDAKLKIQNNSANTQRSKSFAFRAPQENFTIQDFELGKIYGVGSYSKVVRAKKKDTANVYALKIMDKKFITKENKTAYVKLERIVLDQLDHPGVVRLFFTFQDTFSLYMALESCEGGELFDQITRKGRLSEDEACFYAAEVVDALEYIHSMGLIHRDIKVFHKVDCYVNNIWRGDSDSSLIGSQRTCFLLQMDILKLQTLAV